MEITICPYCKTRVVKKADGSCPSCQAGIADAPPPPTSKLKCPSCGAGLPFHAVLCVACGYHTKTGVQLATLSGSGTEHVPELAMVAEPRPIEQRKDSPDSNPYAAPRAANSISEFPENDEFRVDLTSEGADKAKAIVRDAESFWILAVAGFFACQWLLLLMLPWYSLRLHQWNRLNGQFAELRHPNSFSAHGDLATRFQAAKPQLKLGMQLSGAVWLGVIGVGMWLAFGRR